MKTSINNAIVISLLGFTILFPTISHAQSLPPTGGNGDGATQASSSASSLPQTGGNDDGATKITTKPTISQPSDVSANTDSTSGTDVTFTAPTATDALGSSTAVTCNPTSGSHFSIGTTTVTCTTVDSFGNTANTTFNVIVIQNIPTAPISTTIGSYGSNTLPPVTLTNASSSAVTTTATSTSTTTPSIVNNSCPLINTYMQVGADNNNADVIKLQAFLKTNENLDVDLSGIFDSKTEAGVKAFQAKYLSDTMGPWKATTPTGKVYITTKKKINEIACNTPLTLSADELATINAYIQGNQNTSTTVGTVGPSAPTGTTTIGENSNGTNSNTASVVNAPVIQKVWDFIKGIFNR